MSTTPTIGRPGAPAAVRTLTFDDVIATYMVDGVLTMRPETFFPETPRQAWDHLCTPAGELLMSAGGLLVQIAGMTVLIDAGVGMRTSSIALGGVEEWAPYAAGHLDERDATPRHVISQFASGSTDFELFDDGDEIVPGVRALVAPGHTPGHTSYSTTTPTLLARCARPPRMSITPSQATLRRPRT